MKTLHTLLQSFSIAAILVVTSLVAAEQPVQHLVVDDITTYEEANSVFTNTTAEIQTKKNLDAEELHQIHMITYSLEKAVAYFVENTENEQQELANKMAEIVELIHLGSENNRKVETQIYLEEYFALADKFSDNL